MKSKKWIVILCGLSILVGLCACTPKESLVEKASMIKTEELVDALAQFYDLLDNAETEEEKEQINALMQEYVLADFEGYYYYREAHPYVEERSILEDDRVIYVKSKDEVYIVPYSENEMKTMGLTLEDFPNIENSEMYKYRITNAEISRSGSYYYSSMCLESTYINGKGDDYFNAIEVSYGGAIIYGLYQEYNFNGYFVDQTNENGKFMEENAIDISAYREYFRTEERALETVEFVAKENAEYWSNYETEQEELKKSEPKIGMSKSEVERCAWGYPDDKNIDEYEWGTTEQWVYDGKGYVYFENGVVTSIQHR